MIGGIIIGMVEVFGAGYLSSEYKDVFAFIILIAVLYFKPTGIMGENVDDYEGVYGYSIAQTEPRMPPRFSLYINIKRPIFSLPRSEWAPSPLTPHPNN